MNDLDLTAAEQDLTQGPFPRGTEFLGDLAEKGALLVIRGPGQRGPRASPQQPRHPGTEDRSDLE